MVELYADEPLGRARNLHKAYGGDVLNSLVTASRLGARCAFITRVGDDPFGAGLRDAWQREGIDTTHAPLVPGENGVYFVSLLEGGEREFTYRRVGSAASALSSADLDADFLASSRVCLLSGITQAISESAEAATLQAAQLAHSAGVTVAFDPNYRPALWARRGGVAAARAAFNALRPFVDVLLASHPADLPALGNSKSVPSQVASDLGANGMVVALKVGREGAWLSGSPSTTRVSAMSAPAKDATGAGDAWNGAFLAHLCRGTSVLEAATLANATAAIAIRHRGAIPPRVV
jgi:2-dehydro-3-deoxygluconokinase